VTFSPLSPKCHRPKYGDSYHTTDDVAIVVLVVSVGYRKMGEKDVEVGETTINQKEESTILDNF
jgi:hypothetical protein